MSAPACPAQDDRKLYPGRARPQAAYTVDADGLWTINGYHEARQILRSTKVRISARNNGAGEPPEFAAYRFLNLAKYGPMMRGFSALFQPSKIDQQFTPMIEAAMERHLRALMRQGQVDLVKMASTFTGEVICHLVGLTNSLAPGRQRRLRAAFRTLPEWVLALPRPVQRLNAQRHLALLRYVDVLPAMRARRNGEHEDVIGRMVARGEPVEAIEVVALIFSAAGLISTAGTLCQVARHLLERPDLAERVVHGSSAERQAIIHEVLRLEAHVGLAYRIVLDDFPLETGGTTVTIPAGTHLLISINDADTDEAFSGPNPMSLCPGRPLQAGHAGASPYGLFFGLGPHHCVGAPLALHIMDLFLPKLMAVPGLRIVKPPTTRYKPLGATVEYRKFIIAAGARPG